jgi:hypothetical protein
VPKIPFAADSSTLSQKTRRGPLLCLPFMIVQRVTICAAFGDLSSLLTWIGCQNGCAAGDDHPFARKIDSVP